MADKNIALILAGGHGARMKESSIPKQFLEVAGKPIIVYTLEKFENQKLIDGIVIVCIKGWEDYLKNMIHKFNIHKVCSIVEGGETGQLSIRNGLIEIRKLNTENVIVLIHDGVRPEIKDNLIENCILSTLKYGNAISAASATETVMLKKTKITILDRSKCFLIKAPQCFKLSDIEHAHELAYIDKQINYIDSACLMDHYGYKLHYVNSPGDNIKITTLTDFYTFQSLITGRSGHVAMPLS